MLFDGEGVREFEHGEEMASVAFAAVDEMLAGVVVDGDRLATEAALRVGEGAVDEFVEVVLFERLETEERAAGEQGAGEREERVLGGCTDEDEQAFLHEREEDVLLGAAEAVNFVEEHDRALALLAETGAGALGDLAHILHAGTDGGETLERLRGRAGNELGDGGLARARRPPEDERGESVGFEEDPQRSPGCEQVPLADDVIERHRPHPRRERCPAREPVLDRRREQVRPRSTRRSRHPPSLRGRESRHQMSRPTPNFGLLARTSDVAFQNRRGSCAVPLRRSRRDRYVEQLGDLADDVRITRLIGEDRRPPAQGRQVGDPFTVVRHG